MHNSASETGSFRQSGIFFADDIMELANPALISRRKKPEPLKRVRMGCDEKGGSLEV
jgi:hypothetical protein